MMVIGKLFEMRKGVEAVAIIFWWCIKFKPPESGREDIEVNVSI
jgi:hypothetical protein